MRSSFVTRASLLSAALCATSLVAQPVERAERGSFLLGAFITDRNSNTRLDSDAGFGTELDLEDDLGLETSTSIARLGGYYWVGLRHRIDGALFDLSRTSAVPIRKTIRFGDETFDIGTSVETDAELSILKLDYTYAAVARDRGFLGVTAGLYIAKTALSLGERTLGRFESEDITAPLPLFGVRGDYALGERITLRGAAQWLAFDGQDVAGRLTDLYFGADYGFGRRMAIGLAYNRVSMNVDAKEARGFRGRLDWGYDGVLVYFKLDFQSRS